MSLQLHGVSRFGCSSNYIIFIYIIFNMRFTVSRGDQKFLSYTIEVSVWCESKRIINRWLHWYVFQIQRLVKKSHFQGMRNCLHLHSLLNVSPLHSPVGNKHLLSPLLTKIQPHYSVTAIEY